MDAGAGGGAMTDTGVAIRYARALYEAAEERELLYEVSDNVRTLERILMEVPQITTFCRQERDRRSAEMELLKIAFLPYVEEMTGELLKTLVRNGRIGILPDIPAAFHRLEELHKDILEVVAEVAREADQELIEDIRNKMTVRTGREVKVEVRIKPELMGGVRIRWEHMSIDMSVAYRLKQMKAWMKSI